MIGEARQCYMQGASKTAKSWALDSFLFLVLPDPIVKVTCQLRFVPLLSFPKNSPDVVAKKKFRLRMPMCRK